MNISVGNTPQQFDPVNGVQKVEQGNLTPSLDSVGIVSIPDGTNAYTPTYVDSIVYETSHIGKASSGVLFGLLGFNSKVSGQFILVFDSATVPSNNAVPICAPIFVPGQSNFSMDFGKFGRFFTNGIVVTNSSTGNVLTIGSADTWFDLQLK